MDIPANIDYSGIKNISKEGMKSLLYKKPSTISHASRLEGVRPTDILALIEYIKNVSRET